MFKKFSKFVGWWIEEQNGRIKIKITRVPNMILEYFLFFTYGNRVPMRVNLLLVVSVTFGDKTNSIFTNYVKKITKCEQRFKTCVSL